MSILRDLLDVKNDTEREFKFNKRGSVAKESSSGVLQFPVLVSSALSLEEVTTISKALEREYVSFVTIMCSLDSVTDEASIKSYMRKIHQNFGDNLLFGESVQFLPRPIDLISKSRLLEQAEVDSISMMSNYGFFNEDTDAIDKYDDLSEECKKKADKVLKGIKKEGNKLYKGATNKAVTAVNESTQDITQIFFVVDMNENVNIIQTNLILPEVSAKLNEAKVHYQSIDLLEEYKPDLNMEILNRKYQPKTYSLFAGGVFSEKHNALGGMVNEDNIVSTAIKGTDPFRSPTTVNQSNTDTTVMRDVLRDNDVKKANELEPTLLHLKTYFKDDAQGLNAVDYMIGVKTVVHKISSQSMMENIVKSVKKGKAFFNLMRLTTGELSFFRDYVFAVNSIKDDIKTKFKDNPWWNALTRKRKYAKMLAMINFPQQLVPNTTIVMTMDEAIKVKTDSGVDVMNIKTAKDIMDQLFLIGFVVADSSTEVCHFLFDGRDGFEEYSYNSLEKENSNSSKDIKNIMQVLGRM